MESIEERVKQPKYNIDAGLVYSFFYCNCNMEGSFENSCGGLTANP